MNVHLLFLKDFMHLKNIIRSIFLVVAALTLQACGSSEPVIPATVNVPTSKSPPNSADTVITTITFVNKSQVEVKVYWIDANGDEQYRYTLASGASYPQQTATNHPWVARVSSNNAAVLYVVAGKSPMTAEIPVR